MAFNRLHASVSHEIRTPITSLKGFIEILHNHTVRDNLEIQEKFLKIIGEQVQHLTMLVNNLLSLPKVEMNLYITITRIDIIQAINTVIDETYGSRNLKNIEIDFNLENNIPLITANYGQMIQLFTNIICNSIKYAHSNSTFTIKLRLLQNIPNELVNVISNAKSLIEITIKDQSDRIEEKHIARLTERFYMVINHAKLVQALAFL
ncbi:MAG: sensor histidine kinase [Rickettsiales endosymbiont of Dermacentor nuttalli]